MTDMYMYDECRMGNPPSASLARKILDDFDAGRVILHPVIAPEWRERLETITKGGSVDERFYRFSWTQPELN